MNICIVGQYPPQVGGIATYTSNVKDKLESLGHNVYVLTYPSNQKREDNVFEARTVNIPVIRGLSFILSSYRKLLEIVDTYDIDIIHANYIIPPALVSVLVKRKRNIRIITSVHGSDINILANNKILKRLIKYTITNSDDVYFVSEKLYNKALELDIENLAKKSTIISNIVDTNKFKPLNTNKTPLKEKYAKKLVIFIGNLVEQKGLKYLLEAKKLSTTDYALLIYGDGAEYNNLQRQIDQDNITDVYLLGKTTTPESIIPQADIMVLPSISEGASIVALEAMACAKPLISTDTGNIKEVITPNENGVIVKVRDSKELSKQIDCLIDDEQLRIKLGTNARKTIVEKYSKLKIPYIENK